MSESSSEQRAEPSHAVDEILKVVRETIDTIRFGTITLTLHEGRLTQLDVTEKRRFGS